MPHFYITSQVPDTLEYKSALLTNTTKVDVIKKCAENNFAIVCLIELSDDEANEIREELQLAE
jgi:hypothetical protein